MDPDIFDDPQTFKPERWILAAEKKQNLSRFLVTFGKGNRNCIGMK
jgi:cytochrome P450